VPFSGLAQGFLRQGVPAVVAMQASITDDAALIFTRYFYRDLIESGIVDASLTEARLRMQANGHPIEWGTPVLYMRAQSGQLFQPGINLDERKSPPEPRVAERPAARPAAPVAEPARFNESMQRKGPPVPAPAPRPRPATSERKRPKDVPKKDAAPAPRPAPAAAPAAQSAAQSAAPPAAPPAAAPAQNQTERRKPREPQAREPAAPPVKLEPKLDKPVVNWDLENDAVPLFKAEPKFDEPVRPMDFPPRQAMPLPPKPDMPSVADSLAEARNLFRYLPVAGVVALLLVAAGIYAIVKKTPAPEPSPAAAIVTPVPAQQRSTLPATPSAAPSTAATTPPQDTAPVPAAPAPVSDAKPVKSRNPANPTTHRAPARTVADDCRNLDVSQRPIGCVLGRR
jgi:hypothetical protein